jgi:hypothetical protein
MMQPRRIDPHRMSAAWIAALLIERHGERALTVIQNRVRAAGWANYAKKYVAAEEIIRKALGKEVAE